MLADTNDLRVAERVTIHRRYVGAVLWIVAGALSVAHGLPGGAAWPFWVLGGLLFLAFGTRELGAARSALLGHRS